MLYAGINHTNNAWIWNNSQCWWYMYYIRHVHVSSVCKLNNTCNKAQLGSEVVPMFRSDILKYILYMYIVAHGPSPQGWHLFGIFLYLFRCCFLLLYVFLVSFLSLISHAFFFSIFSSVLIHMSCREMDLFNKSF